MVSEDSTSRVMVLPVTVALSARCLFQSKEATLTSLDEDLHDGGLVVFLCEGEEV